ncbi:MAG: hypothetical protein KF878_19900 [Planctomycetes bacterium]|nr:hypothetical protein [Planctomycetota bacterium]
MRRLADEDDPPPPTPPSLGRALLPIPFAALFGAGVALPWLTGGGVPVFVGGFFLPLALLCAASAAIGLVTCALGIALDDEAQLEAAPSGDPHAAVTRLTCGQRALFGGCFLAGAAVILGDALRREEVFVGLVGGGMYALIAGLVLLPEGQRRRLGDRLQQPPRRKR